MREVTRSQLAAADNFTRWCRVGFKVRLLGMGEAKLAEPLMFGVAFLEPPFLTVGADIAGMTPWQLSRTSSDARVLQIPYVAGSLPIVSATVLEWHTDTSGRYVLGANVALFADAGGADVPGIMAHLMFQGDALKAAIGMESQL